MGTLFRLKLYPNINTRIIVPFLLVVAMVAALGIFITTRLVVGSIQERFINQLADSARAATNSLVDLEAQQLNTLRLMAFTVGVPKAIAESNTVDLESLLQPIAGSSVFEQVVVFDTTGSPVFQLSRIPENEVLSTADLPTWAVVQAVINQRRDGQGDKFSAFVESPSRVMLFIAVPVTSPSGEFVGGIVAGITMNSLLKRITEQSLSGVVLYSSLGKVWGSTLGSDTSGLQLSPRRLNELITQVQEVSPVEELQADTRNYQVIYTPLLLREAQVGLMAVALPSNFIIERSSTTRNTFLALFAGLFISVTMVGIGVSQTITRPVARLLNTAQAISAGDLSKRVKLRIPDELGQLGVSFDNMTEQLIQRNYEVSHLYQEQVQETARRDAIISSMSDALFVLNDGGRVTLRNENANALIKWLSKNRSFQARFRELFQQVDALRTARTVELGVRSYRVQTTPIYDKDDILLGSIMTFQDITMMVENERAKDDLIKQMSHELRTPLTAVRGYVELVEMIDHNNISAQGSNYIEQALDGLSVLERMVDEVVEVSSIVSNQFRLTCAPFDLCVTFREILDVWEPQCAARELTISLQSPPSLPLVADQERLLQVMHHLVRNSYSYSLPGGHIHVQVQLMGGGIVIQVEDTGVGIAEDELERVFERMYRGRSADAGPTDARGLGLGLFISKQIIEAHGGTIELVSTIDEGTQVTLQLPVSPEVYG